MLSYFYLYIKQPPLLAINSSGLILLLFYSLTFVVVFVVFVAFSLYSNRHNIHDGYSGLHICFWSRRYRYGINNATNHK